MFCVKTGFKFQIVGDSPPLIYVGDLHYDAGQFEIRGIPVRHGAVAVSNFEEAHAVVDHVTIMPPLDPLCLRGFTKTEPGVVIVSSSAEFVHHIFKWYPALKHLVAA